MLGKFKNKYCFKIDIFKCIIELFISVGFTKISIIVGFQWQEGSRQDLNE